jgi:hypothetical protein
MKISSKKFIPSEKPSAIAAIGIKRNTRVDLNFIHLPVVRS